VSAYADELTARLRGSANTWREAWTLNDDQLAALVRQDQIDILVDLAMHTNGGRPYVFARKPAPVQLSYLAYAGSTGLGTMDYRLTDAHLESSPPAEATDRPLRLPTYWCYEMPGNLPPVAALPAAKNGFVTFGCLNNFAKVNHLALDLWAKLLATPLPNLGPSHFLLFCPEGPHRDRVIAALTKHGIPKQNLHFFTRGPFLNYFNAYNQIDVALDTFPYCGGTTSCDALSMGVPVVTLAGDKPVARAGASILSAANLGHLMAQSPEEYVRIATELASNVAALGELRQSLREKLRGSPLTDAPAFTRHLENAYREAWQNYCSGR
jgi:predicted O-linked N-acetylglucosamine transferase (SPINDLY family)